MVFDEATFSGLNAARWHYAELLQSGALFKGDTIEEAARQAGVDPDGLRKTLEDIRAAANKTGQASAADPFGRRDKLFRQDCGYRL